MDEVKTLPFKVQRALMWATLKRNPWYPLEVFVMTNMLIWLIYLPGYNLSGCIFTCYLGVLGMGLGLSLQQAYLPWVSLLAIAILIYLSGIWCRKIWRRMIALSLGSFYYTVLVFSFWDARIYTAGDGVYAAFLVATVLLVWKLGKLKR